MIVFLSLFSRKEGKAAKEGHSESYVSNSKVCCRSLGFKSEKK